MSRSPCDINVTSDGPMVSFSECQAEGRNSSHVVDVVDFLFLLLSLNWIECELVFRPRMPVTASIHTQQTFQLHFIRRELVVGKTWVTKLQNVSCNDPKQITLKMQVAREIKLHIVHTYVVVRSLSS